ncbi:MAG: hypothetical protein OXF56_26865 [Rhodobacteraceae bacterium]|nr:hypothetical protein [Paracoccaceae bacterium]
MNTCRNLILLEELLSLADLSSVALMKRLAKAGPWLHSVCRALFEERGGALSGSPEGGFEVRLVDAMTVKAPGKTGSLCWLHYSVRLPPCLRPFPVDEDRGAGDRRVVPAIPGRAW